ncbi:uncharacterized protein LOC123668061, partial [Melitaea cinxia]|uniref:uncharacterized protein LOC123668061 n=1 Tax=Melitaea cinxia TaxID=113334 RepID=UPI001E26F8F9
MRTRYPKLLLKENDMPIEYADLLKHCLTSGYMLWNNQFYKQVDGVAMGSPVSPVVADIFMEDFEETALRTSPITPRFYKRKHTHTDRYLNGESHHHPTQLATVGKSLFQRARGICDERHLETELQHVKQVLRDNKLRVPRPHRSERVKPATVERVPAVLPFMKGVTDKIGFILKRASIKTFFKPPKTISQFLPSVKCHIPLQDAGVYK